MPDLAAWARRAPLAGRVAGGILCVSLLLSFTSLGLQIVLTYHAERERQLERVDYLVSALEPALTHGLWVLDLDNTKVLLEGLTRLPDVHHATLIGPEGEMYLAGQAPQGIESINRSYRLTLHGPGAVSLGELRLLISFESLQTRFRSLVAMSMGFQIVETFLLVASLLFLLWWLLSRHLDTLSRYATGLTQRQSVAPIRLQRRITRQDELSRVVDAFNSLLARLNDSAERVRMLEEVGAARVADAQAGLLQDIDQVRRMLQRLTRFLAVGDSDDPVELSREVLHQMMGDMVRVLAVLAGSPLRSQEEFDLPELLEEVVVRVEELLGNDYRPADQPPAAVPDMLIVMGDNLPRTLLGDRPAYLRMSGYLISGLAGLSQPSRIAVLTQAVGRTDAHHTRLRITAEDDGTLLKKEWVDLLGGRTSRLPDPCPPALLANLLRLFLFRVWITRFGGLFGLNCEPGKGNSVWFEVTARVVDESSKPARRGLRDRQIVVIGFEGDRLRQLRNFFSGHQCHLRSYTDWDTLCEDMQRSPARFQSDTVVLLNALNSRLIARKDEHLARLEPMRGTRGMLVLCQPLGVALGVQMSDLRGVDALICDDDCRELLPMLAAHGPALGRVGTEERLSGAGRHTDQLFISPYLRRWVRWSAGESDVPALVLIVDDDDDSATLTRLKLQMAGCHVEICTSGEAAIDRVLQGGVELVLLDCWMPVLDGFETCSRIRALEGPVARTPILGMTGNLTESIRRRAQRAGIAHVLQKPVQITELQKRLEQMGLEHIQLNVVLEQGQSGP